MLNHGLDHRRSREILREKILLMKELWTKVEAEFDGEYVKFEKSWAWPKAVQRPHHKIIMGGPIGPHTADAVAEFCDGWMPVNGLYDIAGGQRQSAAACKARGRDPSSIELGVFGAAPEYDALKMLADAGAKRAIFGLGPVGLAAVQFAHAMGARIIAVDIAHARVECAREFGADDALDSTRVDVVEKILRLTRGKGVSCALEASQRPRPGRLRRVLRGAGVA